MVKELIKKLTDAEFKRHGKLMIMPYEIKYSNRMSRALCTTRERRFMGATFKIEFIWSNKLIREYGDNLKLIKGILYHEIAHAIVGAEHHHDKVFQECAARLGGITTRSVSCSEYKQ